jgi:hypothetical protein
MLLFPNLLLPTQPQSADTVVFTHAPPSASDATYGTSAGPQELLEKPTSKDDNMRMLLDLNGGMCEVVTGVTLGEIVVYILPNQVI